MKTVLGLLIGFMIIAPLVLHMAVLQGFADMQPLHADHQVSTSHEHMLWLPIELDAESLRLVNADRGTPSAVRQD